MGKVRLVQRMCEAESVREEDPAVTSEWCDEDFIWIGLASYEDFLNPHFLSIHNITFQESDKHYEWSYYVQSFDETDWRWHPIGWLNAATVNPRS